MRRFLLQLGFGQRALLAMAGCLLLLSVLFPPVEDFGQTSSGILHKREFAFARSPVAMGFACGDDGCQPLYEYRQIVYANWFGECGLLGATAVGVVVWPLLITGRLRRSGEEVAPQARSPGDVTS